MGVGVWVGVGVCVCGVVPCHEARVGDGDLLEFFLGFWVFVLWVWVWVCVGVGVSD